MEKNRGGRLTTPLPGTIQFHPLPHNTHIYTSPLRFTLQWGYINNSKHTRRVLVAWCIPWPVAMYGTTSTIRWPHAWMTGPAQADRLPL